MGPRDPINNLTGAALTTNQQMHLGRLTDAAEGIYEAMHNAEGSVMPGEHQDHVFMSRRMNIAATHLETALMYARKAALEAK